MASDTARRQRAGYHHGDLRAALLAAAEQELIEKGVEGFSLRGVAKRAGVSHAAPAHHFRDTKDLLTALAALAARRFRDAMLDRQLQAPRNARSQFIASGLGYVEFALANPALFDLMFGSKRPDFASEDFSTPASEAFMVLVEGVAALRGDDPLTLAEGRAEILAAWSLVHGLAELLIAGRLAFAEADLAADREGTILRAIERALPLGGKTC
ncbi:TetR-like C-terminal domain-containing protein [Mesorhizobium sp. LHD-90]|uniref:TetR-like C-terminal domain-containing protein n=1 Tax=Mesorhizobium sp. LHD-90 TaxID=3071414 RepID=UPI0027E0FA8A|nr:TetR-like C-terminal domain-containing protein [Mesorhizobium sp. LHD-90]MDQ6433682.1 TetR-like C-terminal domain-containing protein [Mesorhizobium sp. LHD-90]